MYARRQCTLLNQAFYSGGGGRRRGGFASSIHVRRVDACYDARTPRRMARLWDARGYRPSGIKNSNHKVDNLLARIPTI